MPGEKKGVFMSLLSLIGCHPSTETYPIEETTGIETVHGIQMKRAVSPQTGAPTDEYDRLLSYNGTGTIDGLHYYRYAGDVNGDGFQDELRWMPDSRCVANDMEKMSSEALHMCGGKMFYGTASGSYTENVNSFYAHDGTLRTVGQVIESDKTVVTDTQHPEINGTYGINARIDSFAYFLDYQTAKIVNGLPPEKLGVSMEMFLGVEISDAQGKRVAAFDGHSSLDSPYSYAQHPEELTSMVRYGGDAVPVE